MSASGDRSCGTPAVVMRKGSALSLDDVRGELVKEEDTILFHLYARSHYPANAAAYTTDVLTHPGTLSLLDLPHDRGFWLQGERK